VIVIGILLAYGGYTLGFWGYSLVKGYDVSFKEIISPTAYYKGAWPPPTAPDTVIFPAGGSSGSGASSSGGSGTGGKKTTSGSGGGGSTAPVNGKCPPGTILLGGKCIQHIPVP
jgi:hypothetical protein